MSAPAEDEWETQTTRKQRKQQKKAEATPAASAGAAAASSTDAAAPAAAASSSTDAGTAVAAASSSTFPVSAGGDETGMEGDFLDTGLVGLDGETIPKGAATFVPPAQSDFMPRRQKFAFDPNALPKCFVCQTRHDMGACRKKDKV
jgi:hypothetical protein